MSDMLQKAMPLEEKKRGGEPTKTPNNKKLNKTNKQNPEK